MGRIKNLSPKNTLSAFPGSAPSRGLLANWFCYFSCWQLWERFYFSRRANMWISWSFCLPRAVLLGDLFVDLSTLAGGRRPLRPSWSSTSSGLSPSGPRDQGWDWNLDQKPIFFFQVNPQLFRIRVVSGNPLVLHEESDECMGKERDQGRSLFWTSLPNKKGRIVRHVKLTFTEQVNARYLFILGDSSNPADFSIA